MFKIENFCGFINNVSENDRERITKQLDRLIQYDVNGEETVTNYATFIVYSVYVLKNVPAFDKREYGYKIKTVDGNPVDVWCKFDAADYKYYLANPVTGQCQNITDEQAVFARYILFAFKNIDEVLQADKEAVCEKVH